MNEYTALDKLKEAEREIAQRLRWYPGMIERKTLTMEAATRQTAIMRAISLDYLRIVKEEQRASELPLEPPPTTTILSGG